LVVRPDIRVRAQVPNAASSLRLWDIGDPHALYLAAGLVEVDRAGTGLASSRCLDLAGG
jgi:hypothetical protein